MKKLKIFIPFIFLVILASCGEDSSAAHDSLVSPVDELPDCSSKNDEEQCVVEKSSSSKKQDYLSNTEKSGSSSSAKSSSGKTSSSSDRLSSSSAKFSSAKLSSCSGTNFSAVVSSSGPVSSSSADTGRKLVIKKILKQQINFTVAYVQILDSDLQPKNDTKYSVAFDSLSSSFVVKNLPLDLNYAEITLETKSGYSQSFYASLAGVDTFYVYPGVWPYLRRAGTLVSEKKISFESAKIQAESEMQRAMLGGVKFHNLEQINLEADKSDSALWAKVLVNLVAYDSSCGYDFGQYKDAGVITPNPRGVAGIIDLKIESSVIFCPIGTNRVFCDSAVYERLYPVCDSLSGREKCTAQLDGKIDTLDFGCAGTGRVICDNLRWRHLNTYEVDTYQWERPCTTPGYQLGSRGFDMYFCDNKGEWINTQGWSWDIDKDYVVNPNLEYGTMTDPRDGKVYKTRATQGMVWMAQNLDFRGYVDKNMEDSSLVENMKGKYACYKDSAEYCNVCGTLYDIHAVMNINGSIDISNPYIIREYIQRNHQGVCPDGWHIPTQAEMKPFVGNTYPEHIAARFGWESDLFTGRFANQHGLSVLPCGYKEKGVFEGVGYETYIAVLDSPDVHFESIMFTDNVEWNRDTDAYLHEDALVSVRCVKNK